MCESIAVDFDGVLHSFSSGWQGARVISDPPTDGAINWLRSLICFADVQIYSARTLRLGGKRAMKKWLHKYGLTKAEISELSFPILKPIARVVLDDRAICFKGEFPVIRDILKFEPWHGKPIWSEKDE
jgi:hypothetical protein